ncbi:hypothetical protein ACMSI6_04675 [Pseudomonas antarctica]|uniref:Cytochrome c family protein n=1 Tax=Pseudomonas antarctica TaxID=219572 RepID=A0A1H0BBS6_9PSED|nr:hypothetical protein [Pseudomonas antarctica]KAF2406385.1 hypothetical protein PSAN_45600 [Pseudomonas antarctica]SDN43114.1 hypothetical protein SAMN04490179_4217 [Pseudomonas antarctica]
MRRALSITVLSALAGLAQAQGANTPFDCTGFLQFGGDIDKTRATFTQSPETLAWNWFACLNQPAAAQSPDLVWETMKPSDQVYLANGAQPLPYAQRVPVPPAVLTQAQAMGMNVNRMFHNLNATQQVDGLILEMGGQVPQAQQGQAVRFQLLMGPDTFNYIVQQKVYNVNGQAALTSDLNFPSTAWELKAAWLWIGNNPTYQQQLANDGYYIAQTYYQQGSEYVVGYAALSGLHVINKLNPDWVWTTFENRNNGKYTVTNAIPPTPMTNSTGPTTAAQPVNVSFQASYPALAQYALIGVQSNTTPTLLANSQLESAFQSMSSCFACHSTAAYSPNKGYFNFALKQQGGIVYPTAELPASDFVGYHKLDFVWSLKRAQWQR